MVPICSLKKSLVDPSIVTIINSFFFPPVPFLHPSNMSWFRSSWKTQNWPWKTQITQLQSCPAVSLWKNVLVRFQDNAQHSTELFWKRTKTCSTQETALSSSSLSTCSLWCQWNLLSIYIYLDIESVVVLHLFTHSDKHKFLEEVDLQLIWSMCGHLSCKITNKKYGYNIPGT